MDWLFLAHFARKNRLDFCGNVPQGCFVARYRDVARGAGLKAGLLLEVCGRAAFVFLCPAVAG